MLFFEAELLGMDKLPYRAVIDLQSALGEFGDKPAQCEVPILNPLQQPDTVLAGNCLRLVTAHLAGRDAAGLAQPPHPANRRADPYAKLLRRPIARQATGRNRRNHSLPKIL
jgi:hypothetical protein